MADVRPVILVVDDELSIRESFSLILGKEFKVITAASGEAALKRIIDEKVDLVFLDMRMPGMNGTDTIKRIKEIDPALDIIMVTAVNEVGNAASAVKLGAKDYVVKPFDVDDILNRTRRIVIKAQTKGISPAQKEDLIGNSRQIINIRKVLEKMSGKDMAVLITGEAGVEDSLIAEIIGSESEKDLKTLDASPSMSPAELFGYEHGSFTDAFSKESGILEEASGRILFIRNVDLIPMEIQAKLAEALTKKEYAREGSFSKTSVNVRIVASTSADLKQLIKEGSFDSGLYGIISGTVIELPPLRMRESDLPVLIRHYADKFNDRYNKKIKISEEAVDVFSGYQWPGNVSELSNILESLILTLKKEEIAPEDLPLDILIKSTAGGRPFTSLENLGSDLERAHILNVYNRAGKSKEKASMLLGIQQNALESKLESLNQ